MPINPLQIPEWKPQRDIDFSPLAQLPQVYRQGQQDMWTLANLERLRDARELTPLIKEYNLARNQGFTGTLLDFATARK